ncbi:MAG TPA: glycerophosphodiester phosphodiesterase [Candidatus Limnocylindrales bacterium]|nr:glycerophosphodiester phosphodiesterase [Candidatus Limnocylindrales bacterium]
MRPTHPFLDHPGPIPFAHRGGAEVHPENTMVAFAAAVALGFRYLETDVHVTSDGVLIAFHDDRLDRVTDRRGIVAELPWSEVRQARVGGTEPIVELAELLDAFPDARINIEPKHDAAVPALVGAIRAARVLERVCVGSFSDRRLAAIREGLGRDACTSLGPREIAALRLGAWGARPFLGSLKRRPGRCVQVPLRARGLPLVEPRLVGAAHDLGLPVHAWTVNDPTEMTRLLDLGVDGLMSDVPGVLRAILEARGEWHEPEAAGG